jgi:hypothetical protein
MRRSTTHPTTSAIPALLATLLITALVMLTPTIARSQATAAAANSRSWSDPRITTLMLVDDLGPTDARAVVIRRPGELPNNIILVTRSTTPADLATAASALIHSHRSRGAVVDREIRALIGATPVGTPPGGGRKGGAATPGTKGSAGPSVALAASDLQRLRRAPEFSIAGVGHGPALVIRMSDGGKAKAKN